MDLRSGMIQGALKVLDQALAPFHPGIRALNNPTGRNWDKAGFACRCFLGLRRLRSKLEANLGHNLRVEQFESRLDGVGMIAVVKQDCNLRQGHGLGTKVIEMINQHLD